VFLVSGGARGITAQCVIRLAQEYHGRWILLGRSAIVDVEPTWAENCFDEAALKQRIMKDLIAQGQKPVPRDVQRIYKNLTASRDIQTTLAAIAQAGGEATYLNVDVTNGEALRQQLLPAIAAFGPIRGIIHGAGNLADKLIEKKTIQDFETVYQAKVAGLEHLLACVPAEQLQYLVLFSSVAGFSGNAGQTDYAIANEILNKSAHLFKQHHPHCHVVAMNWGPWESGMVTPELQRAFAERNIDIIPIPVGTQRLVEELAPQHHNIAQVVIGRPLPPMVREPIRNELRSYRIRRQLTRAANPFLQDYVVANHPTLPTTCVASWIATTCEQLNPGYRFSSLENFQILKSIVFDQEQSREFVLDVKEASPINPHEIILDARIWHETSTGEIQFYYNSQIKLLALPPVIAEETMPSPFIANASSSVQLPYYQDKTLWQKSTFQGIQQIVSLQPEQLIMRCYLPNLPEAHQGQFDAQVFNPYMADVLLQGMSIWSKEVLQAPVYLVSIQQITQLLPLPFEQEIYVNLDLQLKTEDSVLFSITAYDRVSSSAQPSRVYGRMSGIKTIIGDPVWKK
jgi:NAD(P)-dependent dehydrogenase (short-subunit alcohol dehydrogenase family)